MLRAIGRRPALAQNLRQILQHQTDIGPIDLVVGGTRKLVYDGLILRDEVMRELVRLLPGRDLDLLKGEAKEAKSHRVEWGVSSDAAKCAPRDFRDKILCLGAGP